MKTYDILISEKRHRIVSIEADSLENAIEQVSKDYHNLDIETTPDDYAGISFTEA